MATFVLIHGAFQGGWIWQQVATRLRQDGHLVYAPTLDGCGERAAQLRPGITTETQAEEVSGFLWSEDLRDVVLETFWSQDWEASVVFCRQAGKPGEAHQRRAADAIGASWHELDSGHYPMLGMPDALTRIILTG